MKILFLTKRAYPEVGGVERHIQEVGIKLRRLGYTLRVISRRNIKYPDIKLFGLFYIWFWLFKNRKLIKNSDIIHCHDVFIWYLPFRFFYFRKPVFTTFHGWEGKWPLRFWDIFCKKLAVRFSFRTIAVGSYIEKYYKIKTDLVIYGAVNSKKYKKFEKDSHKIVFVGRLEKDTGLISFLNWLKKRFEKYSVDFIGSGSLARECMKYGRVRGVTNPVLYYKKAGICVPGGYLSYLEAKSFGCRVMTFAENPLKKDYWQGIKSLKTLPTWDNIANEYLSLYHCFK